jgi:hypothetical protein
MPLEDVEEDKPNTRDPKQSGTVESIAYRPHIQTVSALKREKQATFFVICLLYQVLT